MPYAHFFSILADNMMFFIERGGYVSIFIIVLLEGIPLVGMAVPGHVAIVAAGFLSKIGILSLPLVIIISLIAAILGDFIGFYIGKKYGLSFIDKIRPYFFITDVHLARAQALLSRHTGKAMIIGRFTPATRALMPFLVGTTKTGYGQFWLYNIVGAIGWTLLSILTGYLLGSAYHFVSGYIGRVLLISIPAMIITVWGYRFVNIRFHIFKRYELFILILNIISVLSLALVFENLFEKTFELGFDIWVNAFMAKVNLAWPSIVTLADYISGFGAIWPALFAIFFGVAFLVNHKWRSGIILLLTIGSTALLTGIMKQFFMSPRPANALHLLINDPSFPSGHASMAAAFFLVVAYLLAPRIHSWVKRETMIVCCFLAALGIGLSRLVLNVHWASDVLAGWSLGIFCATSSILFVRYAGALLIKNTIRFK